MAVIQGFYEAVQKRKAQQNASTQDIMAAFSNAVKARKGMSTVDADIQNLDTKLKSITSGWKSAAELGTYKTDVQSMIDRLGSYRGYLQSTNPEAVSALEENISRYNNILSALDETASDYGKYKTAEEYNKTQKQIAENAKWANADSATLEKQIKILEDELNAKYKEQDQNLSPMSQAEMQAHFAKMAENPGYNNEDISNKENTLNLLKTFYSQNKLKEEFNAKWAEFSGNTAQQDESVSDQTYEIINGGKIDRLLLTGTAGARIAKTKGLADAMEENEKLLYNWLYANKGKKVAQEYFDDLSRTYLDQRVNEDIQNQMQSFAGKNWLTGILGSAASVGTNILSGPETLINLGTEALEGISSGNFENVGTTRSQMSTITQGLRAGTQSQWEDSKNKKLWNLLYNTAMSGADSLTAAKLGVATKIPWLGELTLGASAAASKMNDLLDSGATGGTAILGGVMAGTLESLFEHVTIGNINSLKGKAVRDIFKEFGWSKKAIAEMGKDITKNIVVNASEEWATEVGNIIADEIIAGELSNYATMVADNYANGMTLEEAQKAAQDQLKEDILTAAASGGLMGGGISTIGAVAGAVQESAANKKAGKSVSNNGTLSNLVSLAEQTGDKKLAEDAEQLTDNSKPATVGSVLRRTYQHYADISTGQLAKALKATGLSQKEADFGAHQIIQTAFATGDKAGIQQISLMMDQRFGKTYSAFIGGEYGYNALQALRDVATPKATQNAVGGNFANVAGIDNGGNIGYTNNRGESFERTDEFRSLQTESQGMSDEERQFYHRGETNETVRGRISAVLKRQMDAWRNSSGTNNGILKLTARGNQFNIYEDVDGALFHDCFEIARNYLQNGELVDLHDIQTTEDGIGYEDCYNYLSEDGLSGFSITPDGDLISVFNASGRSGFLRAIAPIVKEKAKTLDCYASQYQNLMEMYEHTFGFKTASIMDYNMEFDHDNIAENHGSPKIAFMVNTDADVPTQHFTKDQYDEAVAYRDQFVQQNISTQADSDGSASFMPESDSIFDELDVRNDPEDKDGNYREMLGIDRELTPEQQILVEIGKKLGLEVDFKLRGLANGKISGNKVSINPHAKDPLRFVFKHEVLHWLKNSKLYDKFHDYLLERNAANSEVFKEWMREKGWENYGAAVAAAKKRHDNLAPERLEEEIIADFVGDKLFGARDGEVTADFLQELVQKDRNLFERFVDWVKSMVQRLRGTAVEKDLIKLQQMMLRMKETVDKGSADTTEKHSYAGEKAKTADQMQLAAARRMLRQGVDEETIRQETGWFKGMDGKWRFEISDEAIDVNVDSYYAQHAEEFSRLVLKAMYGAVSQEEAERYYDFVDNHPEFISGLPLDEVIQHDALFAAYPELRECKINFLLLPAGKESISLGKFDPEDNKLTLHSDLVKPEMEELRVDIVVHELQHLIQRIEGFARGSSSVYWENRIKEGKVFKDASGKELTPKELYERTAGEIEANDVIQRRLLDDRSRKGIRPDIDRTDVVFADEREPEEVHNEVVDNFGKTGYTNNRGETDGDIRTTETESSAARNRGWESRQGQAGGHLFVHQQTQAKASRGWRTEKRKIKGKTYEVITEDSYTPAMREISEDFIMQGFQACYSLKGDRVKYADTSVIIPVSLVTAQTAYTYNEGVASFTEQRLSSLIEEYGTKEPGFEGYSRGYVAYITPEEFLGLTGTQAIIDRVKAESDRLDTEELRRQEETPFLVYVTQNGQVVDHEGRHRMAALRADGIQHVAIVVLPEDGRLTERKIEDIQLVGQQFQSGRARGVVNLINAMPLSEKYRPAVEVEYTHNQDADVRYSMPEVDQSNKKATDDGGSELSVKEQIKANLTLLNSMDVVASANETTIFGSNYDVLQWVLRMLEDTGYKVEREGFGEVILDKKRIKMGLSYLKTNEEKLAFALVPEVLKKGVEIGNHPQHKGRIYDTITFAAPVILNNQRGNMAVVVRQDGNNYYKVHRLLMPDGTQFSFDKKRDIAETAGGVYRNSSLSPTDNISKQSITQSNENVKNSMPEVEGVAQQNIIKRWRSGEISADEAMQALTEKYGALPKGENPKVDVQVPAKTSPKRNVRRYARTVAESGHLDEGMSEEMKNDILNGALTYRPISDKAAVESADTAVKEDFLAAVTKWEAIVKSGKMPGKNDIALGERLLQQAAENGHTSDVMQYIAELSEMGTRMGQNIQALRLLKKMTGVGQLYYIERVVGRINEDLQNKYQGKKSPVKINPDYAKLLAEAKTIKDAEYTSGLLLQDIADQMPSTYLDKWNAWRYLSMLCNPRTHVRNLFGNAVFVPAIRIKDAMAFVVERAVKQENRTKVFWALKPEYRQFAREDFKEMQDILTGGGKMNPSDIIRDKQKIFKSKVLETLRRKNSDFMEKEDILFLRMHYVRALGSILQARGLKLDALTEEQLNDARLYAVNEAQKATYRDASEVANALSRFQYSDKKSVRALGMLTEGILPFKKTPINILKRGVEYSPAGLIKALGKGLCDLKKGNIKSAEFIDGISAGLTGTGILILGAFLQSLGFITGGLGYEEEDALERMAGAQPYSLTIGDFSYTIDWMAPAVLPFLVGAEIGKFVAEDEERSAISYIVDCMTAIGEPMVNLSMLSGLNDMIEAVAYSDNKLTDMLLSAGLSYASQGLPTIGGQIARTFDGTRRQNYVDKGSDWPVALQTFYQKAAGKIPWLENQKAAYVDAWGRTESTGHWAIRTLENFASPGYASKITHDPVDEEIARLFLETKETSVIPTKADKTLRDAAGNKVNLSADGYVKYAKRKGSLQREYVERFMDSSLYNKLDDTGRATVITEIYSYAKGIAQEEMTGYISNENAKTKKYASVGVRPEDYLAARVLTSADYADKNGSASVTKSEYTQAVNNSGLDSSTKSALLRNYGKKTSEIK